MQVQTWRTKIRAPYGPRPSLRFFRGEVIPRRYIGVAITIGNVRYALTLGF